ncbi:chordin short gastrulation [Lycorma delicatula]|uniref:chordin short gastrulation n=1 Tax=Lycorma delicatula TaxID=130591 RepID=UPI003F50D89F
MGNFTFFLIFLFTNSVLNFKLTNCSRRHLPLFSDEGTRKSSQAAECQFGKQLRELGSVWFADLGPPFGIMYCIRCECVPYQKKRRVIGKVHCRNIKNECPKPTCDEPVLPPGKCCKVCPGDKNSPDNITDDLVPIISVEEEKNMKHFAAVLTARIQLEETTVASASTLLSSGAKDYVATGRFAFHKRNLYFSFYFNSRPRGVQFIDQKGNILEEQVLSPSSVYQNDTGKICGVWRRIPREYRRLIREEKLLVTLLWERADLSITGQLYRFRALNTELYSALLEGTIPMSGGTAIVSVSTTAPSIHLTIAFIGLFTAEDVADVIVIIKLQVLDSEDVVLEDSVKVDKPSSDMNLVEVRSPISLSDLQLLSKHKLKVIISTKSGATLSGKIMTRTTCEIFHAPLIAPIDTTDVITTPVSGLAWMYIDMNGALKYHVQLDQITQLDMLGLVIERRLIELEDLTPSFRDGWANGTIDGLSVRHLEQLYNGELAINVATPQTRSLVRGKLTGRPLADARDAKSPSLLKRYNPASPAELTGFIWAAVDIECNLHYEVVLAGLVPENHPLELYLEEIPFVAPGAPVSRRLLAEFSSIQLEDFILGMSPHELIKLDSGVVYFDIKDTTTQKSILKTQWKDISIPMSCLPHYSDNNVPAINFNNDGIAPETAACFHGDRFHDEGTQWPSTIEHCVMCTCRHGRVKCDNVICPATSCTNPVLKSNQCCPSCEDNSDTNMTGSCQLAGQTFPAGATWHPYLPPNGFDSCATCTCNSTNLKVKCTRVECPPLPCDESVAVRKSGCCKICPSQIPGSETSISTVDTMGWLGDQQDSFTKTKAEILASGGCNYPFGGPYENGHEWHPRVYSHGEVKWVKCHCKDGKVRCERNKKHH